MLKGWNQPRMTPRTVAQLCARHPHCCPWSPSQWATTQNCCLRPTFFALPLSIRRYDSFFFGPELVYRLQVGQFQPVRFVSMLPAIVGVLGHHSVKEVDGPLHWLRWFAQPWPTSPSNGACQGRRKGTTIHFFGMLQSHLDIVPV